MTVSDTHADTIRDALFWTPTYKQAKNNGYVLEALDALVAERDRERARATDYEKAFNEAVSAHGRERARADRAEAALRELWDYTGRDQYYVSNELRAQIDAALSAGSGGREPTPAEEPVVQKITSWGSWPADVEPTLLAWNKSNGLSFHYGRDFRCDGCERLIRNKNADRCAYEGKNYCEDCLISLARRVLAGERGAA